MEILTFPTTATSSRPAYFCVNYNNNNAFAPLQFSDIDNFFLDSAAACGNPEVKCVSWEDVNPIFMTFGEIPNLISI